MSRLRAADRVLIRLPSWLGDFVMAEPVVRAVASSVTQLTLAGPAPFLDLLQAGLPTGSARILLSPGDEAHAWRGHDLALFLNGSLRSVLCALRARIPLRVGWASGGRSPFLTCAVGRAQERGGKPTGWGLKPPLRRGLPRSFAGDCLELAATVGVALREPRPRLRVSEEARATFLKRLRALGLGADEPYLAVNVGARANSAKGYPPELWGGVLAELARDPGLPLLVLCGPGEEQRLRIATEAAGSATVLPLVDPALDLQQLAACAQQAELFICVDGGARHVAKAVGARTVAIFGPTDPRHTLDHREREEILVAAPECGPCHLELCPLVGADAHVCMREHHPQQVAEIVRAARRRMQ